MEPKEYCNVDLKRFGGHKDEVNCVAFSPDFEMMVTGSDDYCVRVFNARTSKLVCRLRHHNAAVRCLAVRNDSKYFASGSFDKSLIIYRTRDASVAHALHGHEKSVECVTFSYSGHLLISGSWDRSARIWSVTDGRLLALLRGHSNLVQSVACSRHSTFMATGSWDFSVRVWTLPDFNDVMTDQSGIKERNDFISDQSGNGELKSDQSESRNVVNPPLDTDGTLDVIIEEDIDENDVSKTNVLARDVLNTPDDVKTRKRSVAVEREDVIGDVKTLEKLPFRTLSGHLGNVYTVSFSRAGMLASGSWDKTVRLWNPRNGRLLHILQQHTGWVRAVSFTFDSCYLATAADDGDVLVWDVLTGHCLRQLQACSESVQQCGFTQAGALVASGTCSTTLHFASPLACDL